MAQLYIIIIIFATDDGHLIGRNAYGCDELNCIKVVG
jgi:hypothetical protein